MLEYPRDRQEIQKILDVINTGRYFGIAFVKKSDGTIRVMNGHKIPKNEIEKIKQRQKERGIDINDRELYGLENPIKSTKLDQNTLLLWDRNAPDYKTGKKGAYRSAKLDNIIFVKSGDKFLNFMDINDIKKRFPHLTNNDFRNAINKMKINSLVQEEIDKLLTEMWGGRGMLNPEGLSDSDYELVKQAWDLRYGDNFDNLVTQCESGECRKRIKDIEKEKYHDEEYSADNL